MKPHICHRMTGAARNARPITLATLSVSPGYVLVRGRDGDRINLCCDGITGNFVGNAFAFTPNLVNQQIGGSNYYLAKQYGPRGADGIPYEGAA